MNAKDKDYMRMALDLAAKATGRTSPNPMVGAAVVRNGQIVGEGYHARAGTPHAEVHALRRAGDNARGSTLYVTLEPCCHYGRTGPCTEAIIKAGIDRVVLAMADPNPLVAGKGVQRLRESGIKVDCGIMENEARKLNEVFIKFITTRLPFVVMKTAMSLDGKIATTRGESQWITGPKAREYVHHLRDRYDAILVGVGTVLADNPSLTTRLPGVQGRDPVRIILDSMASSPVKSKVFNQQSESSTIIVTSPEAPADKVSALRDAGAEIIQVPLDENGINLLLLLQELGSREITSVLVEGGAKVNGSFTYNKLVDKVYWFIAPQIIGGDAAPSPVGGKGIPILNDALQISDITMHSLGKDICIEGYVDKRSGS